MIVEVLYFEGCPNYRDAAALVERIAAELGASLEVRLVPVVDAEAAARLRFPGSPTVRIDGRDVEPGADGRTDHVLACRVYATEAGFSGLPAESWVRDALGR